MGAALLRVCLPILWPQGLVLCLVAAAVAWSLAFALYPLSMRRGWSPPGSMAKTVEAAHSLVFTKGSPMSARVSDTIDVRAIAPRERHALIFNRFDALPKGGSLQLVNDHDPAPCISSSSCARRANSSGRIWSRASGWRIQITKLVPITGADSCCSGGACCG